MSLYLRLGLFAEGPSDFAGLPPILSRATHRVCARHVLRPVEIAQDVEKLNAQVTDSRADRAVRIRDAVLRAKDAISVAFLHSDADGDRERALAERIQPGMQRLEGDSRLSSIAVVPVVPARAMEAWLLADEEALRETLGLRDPSRSLSLPARVQDVESLPDPKLTLDKLVDLGRGGRRRRRRNNRTSDYIRPLAERISLEKLSLLPSFQDFLSELEKALREKRFIP